MTHGRWAKWGLYLVMTIFFLTILLIVLLKQLF
jgi:hypothetical protein